MVLRMRSAGGVGPQRGLVHARMPRERATLPDKLGGHETLADDAPTSMGEPS